jgi:hypothetical protein
MFPALSGIFNWVFMLSILLSEGYEMEPSKESSNRSTRQKNKVLVLSKSLNFSSERYRQSISELLGEAIGNISLKEITQLEK